MEVGRVQPVVERRQPVVDGPLRRAVDRRHGGRGVDGRRPAHDRAGLRVEQEPRRAGRAALADDEGIRVRVRDGTRRAAGNGHRQGVLRAASGVERRRARLVVRRPPWRTAAGREPPAVHERAVGQRRRHRGTVGDQRVEVVRNERMRSAGARRAEREYRREHRKADERHPPA